MGDHRNVGLAQEFKVSTIYVTNFNSAARAFSPTHFWIADIKKWLAWALKKQDRCVEAGNVETLAGPICFGPFCSLPIAELY